MKRYIVFSLLLLVAVVARGQRYSDYGIFIGGASYLGDLNSINVFYRPSSAIGGFFRQNMNKRVALRISGNYLSLSSNPGAYPDLAIVNMNPSFPSAIMDFNGQVEFNFLPYMTGEDKFMRSFYVSGGLGYSMLMGRGGTLTIPFGVGYKVNITDRLSAGAELSFRRTFTDNLDNVQSVLGHTLFNNNDWYSVYGLFISYKFVKFAADCPVYK